MRQIRGNNSVRAKKQNAQSIKEVVYRFGPISRLEIADLLDLTPPTISTSVNAMVAEGLMKECGNEPTEEKPASPGRRRVQVNFIPTSKYFIGVELGPYSTYLCVLNLLGKEVASKKAEKMPSEYSEMVLALTQEVKSIIAQAKVPHKKVAGVGVGLPGFIDAGQGIIMSGTKPSWKGKNFAEDLSKAINMPVCIENNARARAIGADLLSDFVDNGTFAYYFISNGVACPLVVTNNVVAGETSGAGEVGHMVMDLNGRECNTCGKKGCLDAYGSEQAIRHKVNELLKKRGTQQQGSFEGEAAMYEILKAQQDNDFEIIEIVNQAITYLGVALANIINLISPSIVLVDGLLFSNKENREQLVEVARKHMFGLNATQVDIRFKPYEDGFGAKGAAADAIRQFFIK